MIDKENWSAIQKNVVDVSNKIKNQIANDDNISDLKQSLFQALENTTSLIKEVSSSIEDTLKDEEIRNEVKEVVSKINTEFHDIAENTKKRVNFLVDNIVESDFKTEEE